MATSVDCARVLVSEPRPLAETAFENLREAVLIVDARVPHLPLVSANATARRCLLGSEAGSLVDSSLLTLLGAAAGEAVEAVCALRASGPAIVTRVMGWRAPRGEMRIATELRLLPGGAGQRMVMLSFAETAAGGGALFSAIEHLPLDLLMLDGQLRVTYANASALRTAGGLPGGILGHSAVTLLPTLAISREVFDQALNGVPFHSDSVSVPAPGAGTRWFEIDVQPLKDASGVVGVAVLSTEVTKRRLRRPVPAEGERRLLALTEHARDIITVADRTGRLQYISGGIRNSLGYSVEERRSSSIFEHIHPDDVAAVRFKYGQLIDGVIGPFAHQFRIRHKDGSYRWLESNYVPALDNPLVKGVVINSRDITERRQAESHLAQREEVFRLAADAVNGIIFEWDLAGKTVHRSRGVQEVLGLDPQDFIQQGAWSSRIHPQDRVTYAKVIDDAFQQQRGWTATYRIRDSRGRYRSMLERSLIQRTEAGVPLRAIGCCVDVTEIKRLTDLLAETQCAAQTGGWEYSYATEELTWTDEMFRIFEARPGEFPLSASSTLARFVPDSRQRFDEACKVAARGNGNFDLELEIVTLKEHRVWVRVIGHFESLDGRAFRAYGSVQNIQAQKLAQMALENSTGWLKLSMNMAKLHAWRWDRGSDSLEFAILDGQMTHLPRVFPGMKKLMSRMHPRDRLAARRAIDKAFATKTEVQEEFRLRSKNGHYRSYAAVARPLFDAADQPSGLVGVTQDVTARHESEARLRRSEELLRTTTANSADTLLLVDTDLRVRFINRGELGMSIEEIIGQSIAVLLPEAAREGIIAKLRQVLATAAPVTYEFDVKAVGAETQYLENRAVLVRDDGIGTGISITVRNITERKRLEREILDVSSRERQTIGRDLHDGLGQELTGVALMLRGLATRIRRQNPESVDQVDEIVGLVNQSIETARSLARGLLPVTSANGGLTFALRALAERSRELYGIRVEFRLEARADLPLSEVNASHLYRIAQEALTNTARHGRATMVDVYLRVSQEQFLLQIADDGVGIGGKGEPDTGLGLKIMKYRASMIGARFEIAPNVPHGTVVRVSGEQPLSMSPLQSAHAI